MVLRRSARTLLEPMGQRSGVHRGIPKVSVYLPDDLHREARERNLPLSALTQDAVERAIRTAGLSDWIADMRTVPRRTSSE